MLAGQWASSSSWWGVRVGGGELGGALTCPPAPSQTQIQPQPLPGAAGGLPLHRVCGLGGAECGAGYGGPQGPGQALFPSTGHWFPLPPPLLPGPSHTQQASFETVSTRL